MPKDKKIGVTVSIGYNVKYMTLDAMPKEDAEHLKRILEKCYSCEVIFDEEEVNPNV